MVDFRDGRRAHLRVRGCAARRADFRFHDRRLGAAAARAACARIQPDHQRGARHQPRGLRHLLQAEQPELPGLELDESARSLLGIAGKVTAPTYAELYGKKRPTISSVLGS